MTTFATDTIFQLDTQIAQTEETIRRLQEQLSVQQSERQNAVSIEQMGISAIGQIIKTLTACEKAGFPGLAASFKANVTEAINSDINTETNRAIASLPLNTEPPETVTDKPIVTPPPPTENVAPEVEVVQPSDDEILDMIKELDKKHRTENYLPIFYLREQLPMMSWDEQDAALYRLVRNDFIEMSSLQDVRAYTPEQVKQGIKQDIGGRLFFLIVEEIAKEEAKKMALDIPIHSRQLASVGAAAAVDIGIMEFKDLKAYALDTLKLNKDDIREYGNLTRRETWIKAIKQLQG